MKTSVISIKLLAENQVLWRWRTLGLLSSQPSTIGGLQNSQGPSLNKQGGQHLRNGS